MHTTTVKNRGVPLFTTNISVATAMLENTWMGAAKTAQQEGTARRTAEPALLRALLAKPASMATVLGKPVHLRARTAWRGSMATYLGNPRARTAWQGSMATCLGRRAARTAWRGSTQARQVKRRAAALPAKLESMALLAEPVQHQQPAQTARQASTATSRAKRRAKRAMMARTTTSRARQVKPRARPARWVRLLPRLRKYADHQHSKFPERQQLILHSLTSRE